LREEIERREEGEAAAPIATPSRIMTPSMELRRNGKKRR
jgi:hypothetical protein